MMKIITLLASMLFLTACLPEETPVVPYSVDPIIAVHSSVYGDSSGISLIGYNDNNELELAENIALSAEITDIAIAEHDGYLFKIGRGDSDSLVRYDLSDKSSDLISFSFFKDNKSNNAYDLVFVSSSKAYLVNYNLNELWVVNPMANSSNDFFIKEIDLSAYAQTDSEPRMHAAKLIGDKLYVSMQRLKDWTAIDFGYVAVIDTNTDLEVDTQTNNSFKGINQQIYNPMALETFNNKLYSAGGGTGYSVDSEFSGMSVINTEDYSVELVFDEADVVEKQFGMINDIAIVDGNKGYFITTVSYGNNKLFEFNPSDLTIDPVLIEAFSSRQISFIETHEIESVKYVVAGFFTGTDAAAELIILDSSDNSEYKSFEFLLNPISTVSVNL